MAVIAYTRVSTHNQDTKNQQPKIRAWAKMHDMDIDEWIEVSQSSGKSRTDRRINEVLDKLKKGDVLITYSLDRLARSVSDSVDIMDRLSKAGVRVVVVKQGLDISEDSPSITTKVLVTVLSLVADIERDMIRARVKDALARKKAEGFMLGRPKGTIGKSKLDKHRKDIELLLVYGVPIAEIARKFDSSYGNIYNYIKTRKLKQ